MERAFPGVYWNPARWGTTDGYIPFPVFDLYAAALFPALAMDRLNMYQAVAMLVARQPASERALEQTTREIYQAEG